MTVKVSERAFEEAIEASLLKGGPDATVLDEVGVEHLHLHRTLGTYQKRRGEDYDRTLCLIPRDVLDFVLATQPQEWKRLSAHYGTQVKSQFLKRLSAEIGRRGAIDVLRNGIRDMGCRFQLAYFRPASGLNEETRRLYMGNFFSVIRQLPYSAQNNKSIDLVLFLNGIPIFTTELKNPLTGQNVRDAIRQYRQDRDPREPLLAYGRCLAHYAVDPDLVYVTTRLDGPATRFLPFNQGKYGGAGNPPAPLSQNGYATSYLWEQIWTCDSILDLIRQFIQYVETDDGSANGSRGRSLIFPRYHQIDCVRKLVAEARTSGAGQRYLIQHSAGSGKSYTIAWLAHQLSTLHGQDDRRVFDSIVVISDRRVLDRQLQRAVSQFEQTLGVVENIDKTSRQLKQALESGKTIIVATLQKFPFIAQEISELPGQRFALIVDEAHSSQSGETSKSLAMVLSSQTLPEAETTEAFLEGPDADLESRILAEIARRGPQPNISTFAFTATPKPKTLELFGTRQENGTFRAFHVYSMRQAIEEGFILDTLAHYATYRSYWRLSKTIESDPRYDKSQATLLLKSFVDLHPHAVREKVGIILEHFAGRVQSKIQGRAKAMIVTRSRLHAVRYKLEVDKAVAQRNYGFRALVAFSGTVQDGRQSYTETGMNGFPETQTASAFEQSMYRILIVASKFQTGFDQPLLHTMYVDRKLGGVNAVQTLSRLNRTHPDKQSTMVLDFANEADEIKAAFAPYYETTVLSEETDPNLLYTLQIRFGEIPVFTESEVRDFADLYFKPNSTQEQIYGALVPMAERFLELSDEDRADFRKLLTDYVRQYAFLSQVLTFADPDLERLYVFARHLRSRLPLDSEELPLEIRNSIDMDSFRIQQTGSGKVELERQQDMLHPVRTGDAHESPSKEDAFLSDIIAELNDHFGIDLGPEHRVTLHQVMRRLDEDVALKKAVRVNTQENIRLAFNEKVNQFIREIVDSNFDLYKRINDDERFGLLIRDRLFENFLDSQDTNGELTAQDL